MIIAIIDESSLYRSRIYNIGVYDYISTPIIPSEVRVRIKSAIHNILRNRESSKQNIYSPEIRFEYLRSKKIKNRSNYRGYELVMNTCQYVLQNLSKKLSTTSIAHAMATNKNSLSNAFSNVLGISLFKWIREERLFKAKWLLSTTELSIQEIGFEVGYKNTSNFATTFKAKFSLSPTAFRKSVIQTKNKVTCSKA
ncbi:MAG: AraC family transcriptional regulator [Candidatus Thiodiazotropha endolucinida]|uniref:AraC family transcriptional regulator n=1 Tax=Candidatus Thiodiazotropha taylori TaxID=2792791 RepID=A0A9E4TTZ6_9GAMM|nr:AraC family transcriptional regulator [Candidatus Thiodiazotropha taylori]MCW4237956.1 AraC family transcriptional regulator [Candidatus Thiodiazotropha endolucinida]